MAKCEKCNEDCEKSIYGKTLCFNHYLEWSKQDTKLQIHSYKND